MGGTCCLNIQNMSLPFRIQLYWLYAKILHSQLFLVKMKLRYYPSLLSLTFTSTRQKLCSFVPPSHNACPLSLTPLCCLHFCPDRPTANISNRPNTIADKRHDLYIRNFFIQYYRITGQENFFLWFFNQ